MSAVNLGFYNTSTSRTKVRFQFSTHAAAGGNVAPLSGFEAADLRIYKAADSAAFSATQRSSAIGITMTSPFDSLTGFHDVVIDLTDNTDAGFYGGGFFSVVLAPDTETIDSQTVTAIVLAYFEIGVPAVNAIQFGGDTVTASGGVIPVDVVKISGDSTAADNSESFFDGTGYAGTNNVIPSVTTVTGNVTGTIGGLTAAALKKFFDTDSTTVYSSAVAGSVVKEIADNAGGATANPFLMASGTIGSTGNDATHLHLTGLTFGDDEINDCMLVIRDVSESEYHARWVADWADTGDLATVATLPFTPQNGTDTYKLLAIRRDVTGGSGLDAAGVRAAIGLASANLDTQLDALPTNSELATALGTADDAVLAAIASLNNLSQANIRTAIGLGSANLDTQLDALPTNAELATALGTADDATLAAIAALNNLSQANIRTAIGLGSANLDTQLADLPTNSELTAALAGISPNFYVHEFDSGFTSTSGVVWNGLFSLASRGEFVNIYSVDSTATLAVSVVESTSGLELFALTAATVGSDGRWKLTKNTPNFTADRLYRFEFTAVVLGVTTHYESYVPVHG